MRFMQAWTELSPFDLARLLAPLALVAMASFLPGRRVARLAAVGLALALPWLRELAVSPLVGFGWVWLWLLIAWRAGLPEDSVRPPLSGTPRVLESGTIGLLLGGALLVLLIAAVARQDMSPEDARRSTFGVAMIGLGLLHLMLRRHARRAAGGFAVLGLGLQVLGGAAAGSQVQPAASGAAAVLLATTLAVVLALRLAESRDRYAGTAWVSDAHDLHD